MKYTNIDIMTSLDLHSNKCMAQHFENPFDKLVPNGHVSRFGPGPFGRFVMVTNLANEGPIKRNSWKKKKAKNEMFEEVKFTHHRNHLESSFVRVTLTISNK